jgi:uncharacterized Fe-S center protein
VQSLFIITHREFIISRCMEGRFMGEKVYFAGLRCRDPDDNTISKIKRLFDAAGFSSICTGQALTAVKLHFGESGSDAYINPVFVRQVVDKIREHGGKPFITDSNTLYRGSRSNAVDHITTAIEHGFAYAVVGAPLIIADGLSGRHYTEVEIHKKHFRRVRISGDIHAAKGMIVLSHVKGHEVAGFGGAIKNLAMGCAPPAGKQDQHSARPMPVEGRCSGCGTCVPVCPGSAISVENGKSSINRELCIGCFACMAVCPENAIEVDWETEIPLFVERMVEYAYGAALHAPGRIGYMNFLTRITPDCDCLPWSDAPVVPDIGFLASRDPVAIDAASIDLVNSQAGFRDSLLQAHFKPGEDKFRGIRPQTDGYLQIRYAEEIGLGSASYELVPL